MGCVSSRIDNEERVQNCKERKRVAKQLLGFRKDFAGAIVSYLRALKDTGITLRQFSESESLESALPPSPPLPLPPSPPRPPPIDSPNSRKLALEGIRNGKEAQEEILEVGEDNNDTPPPLPPPPPPFSWDFVDSFESSIAQHKVGNLLVEDGDDENWAETKSNFEDEDQDNVGCDALGIKSLNMDENSLIVNGETKDMVSRGMKVWRRRRKMLADIVKELDDYFLKLSASGKEIAVLVDMGTWNTSTHYDLKTKNGKANNSGRLSSLTWTWSSRSLQVTKDSLEICTPNAPCKPGAHCVTLEKIFAREQKLYATVKEEEQVKLEHKRRSSALQKLEQEENVDLDKIEKAKCVVENLGTEIIRLQELVKETSTSILAIIDEELQPQLIALLSGLIHMWKTMYECHKFQTQISWQLHYLAGHNMEPTTENHREATIQLVSGISFLYNSFCRLSKTQRGYVEAMCTWIRLATCPIDGENEKHGSSNLIYKLCDKWLLALDRLPEKVLADAIDNFLKVIQLISKKQEEEFAVKKQFDKLERRLHREQTLAFEMEKKLEAIAKRGEMPTSSNLSPTHPLMVKRVKIDRLRKELEDEKARYLSFIKMSKALALSNLQKTLPHVFEALLGFSGACTQALESVLNRTQQAFSDDAQELQAQT